MGQVHHGGDCPAKDSEKEETLREVNFPVTKKLVQNVQEKRSNGIHLERRVSPRLKSIPKEQRPYYGSEQRRRLFSSKHEVCLKKTEDDDQMRLFDCPDDNVPMSNGKVNIDARKASRQHALKKKPEGLHLERRVSPRLKDVSADKRPYYGSVHRRQLNASKDEVCNTKTEGNNSNMQLDSSKGNVHNECAKTEIVATENSVHQIQTIKSDGEENNVALSFALIVHDGAATMDLKNEASLKFSRSETFLAGSMHRMSGASDRKTAVGADTFSNDHSQNSRKHNAKNEIFDVALRRKIGLQFQKIRSTEVPLERRVSPRLKNIPIDKRPFYGSNREGRVNTANGFSCNNNDWKRKLSSLKDKSTRKISTVDHFIQEIGDRDTGRLLDAVSLPVMYGNAKILDLKNGADTKLIGCKRLLADQMCQRASARVNETMRPLNKHHIGTVQTLDGIYALQQQILPSHGWHREYATDRASKDFSILPGLVCKDISYGQEKIPIPATNLVDPPMAPGGYKYTKTIIVGRSVMIPPSPPGCNCKGNCTNPKYCSCARLNGSDFPYVDEDGGRLIEPKDVVFECGPRCGCGPNCINRVSQQELKYRFEVYRTLNKGWAVRSWDLIPSGAFVCEYIGVLRRCADLDSVSDNDYIFEIDCWHTMKGIGGRERRQGDVSRHARDLVENVNEAESDTEFCVDGGSCSNVTRFINHSCDPNLFVQCVLSSHRDIRFARIVLFAADDIPPMQELTYDYGYALDSVISPDGKIKKMPCYCGTSECRGRLF